MKNPDWMEAASLDEMITQRNTILSCGLGTDIDYTDIEEELGEGAVENDNALAALWFDACAERLRTVFAGGRATIYRAMAVDDVNGFLADTARGAPVGICWTWDQACATTRLSGEAWKPHEIVLTAEVTEDAVEWPTTLQQHFSHPCEKEVRVKGSITLMGITHMDTGIEIPWERQLVAA